MAPLSRCPALGGLALLLALSGCHHHHPAPLVVQKLSVSQASLDAAPQLGLGPKVMRREVHKALRAQGVLLLHPGQPGPKGAPRYRLRAEVQSAQLRATPLPDGGVRRRATVEVFLDATRLGSDGEEKVSSLAQGQASAPGPDDLDGQAQSFGRAFTRALTLGAARLARSAAAGRASVKVLRHQLASPDAGVRQAAADALVDRHDRAAIPVLIAELDSADPDVRMKAIGELVQLKAKAAVPKLIDLAERPEPDPDADPRLEVQIIYALGSIGGSEAAAYLYTIASGHPDPRVRSAAKHAAADLRAHQPKNKEPPP